MRLPVAVALAVAACVSTVGAQWPNAPSPRLPRNVDGTPTLTAPAPRTADNRVYNSDRMRLTERFARRTRRPNGSGELIEYVCSENVKPLRR